MKNEKGYTLVLVMIIITVTMIFALSLSSITLNTRTQLTKTDNRNKATDLAELGVTYFQSVVTDSINSASTTAAAENNTWINNNNKATQAQINAQYDSYFYTDLGKLLNVNLSAVTVDQVTKDNYQVTFNQLINNTSNGIIQVIFTSTGNSSKESVPITGTFTITKGSTGLVGQPNPSSTAYTNVVSNSLYLSPPAKVTSYSSSTFFSSLVHIQGNHKLSISGNAYFSSLELAGSAKLYVDGDAVFGTPISIQDNGVKQVCITGNTYLYNSSTKLLDAYQIPQNTCSQQAANMWTFDKKTGTKVTY